MQKGFEVVNLHGTASGVIAVPVIGENGNWWIGNEDTGVCAGGGGSSVDAAKLQAQIDVLEKEIKEMYQSGHTGVIECTGNSIAEYTVVFQTPFESRPDVVVSLYSGTASPMYGGLTVFVFPVTEKEFTVKIANNTPNTVKPDVNWIAVKRR